MGRLISAAEATNLRGWEGVETWSGIWYNMCILLDEGLK